MAPLDSWLRNRKTTLAPNTGSGSILGGTIRTPINRNTVTPNRTITSSSSSAKAKKTLSQAEMDKEAQEFRRRSEELKRQNSGTAPLSGGLASPSPVANHGAVSGGSLEGLVAGLSPTTSATGGSAGGSGIQNQFFQAPTNLLSPEEQRRQDMERAQDLVDVEFEPRIKALERLLETTKRERDRDIDIQERYGKHGDELLQNIAQALAAQLKENTGRVEGIYDTARERVGQGYDEATRTAEGAVGAVRQGVAAEAQRLGIEEGLTDPLGRLSSEMEALRARNASSRAGATGNLANLGADMTALSVQAETDAAREWAQNRSRLVEQVQRAISDVQFNAGQQMAEINGQLVDLHGAKGIALRNALREVEEARTDRERQAKLDALAEEVQRNAMQLQWEQLGLAREGQAFNQQLATAQFGLASQGQAFDQMMATQQFNLQKQQYADELRMAEQELAAANSPMAQLEAALKVQKLQAEIQNLNARTQNTLTTPPGGQGSMKGLQGLNNYYGMLEQAFSPQQVNVLRNEVQRIVQSARNDYGRALAMIPQSQSQSRVDLNTLRTALEIYYRGY